MCVFRKLFEMVRQLHPYSSLEVRETIHFLYAKFFNYTENYREIALFMANMQHHDLQF